MLISFSAVLVFIFLPVFDGKNTLDEVDDLFNRVSKSSSDKLEDIEEEAQENVGTEVSFTATADDAAQAERIVALMSDAGAQASAQDKKVDVSGDIGEIMLAATDLSRQAFDNESMEVTADKTGKEKPVPLYDWFTAIDTGQKDLQSAGEFDNQKLFLELSEKAIEPAYNYYGIEESSPSSEAIAITVALIGYVIYTLWYGFAILFMFEGYGIKLEH
ncbi:MAG: hypothetical protein C4534_05160 [Gaiellales bacterium]|nr:MAG: hypothetical protein C4534_05160 [Gaiellales bacterium]